MINITLQSELTAVRSSSRVKLQLPLDTSDLRHPPRKSMSPKTSRNSCLSPNMDLSEMPLAVPSNSTLNASAGPTSCFANPCEHSKALVEFRVSTHRQPQHPQYMKVCSPPTRITWVFNTQVWNHVSLDSLPHARVVVDSLEYSILTSISQQYFSTVFLNSILSLSLSLSPFHVCVCMRISALSRGCTSTAIGKHSINCFGESSA